MIHFYNKALTQYGVLKKTIPRIIGAYGTIATVRYMIGMDSWPRSAELDGEPWNLELVAVKLAWRNTSMQRNYSPSPLMATSSARDALGTPTFLQSLSCNQN